MAEPVKENQYSVLIVAIAFLVTLQAIPYLHYMNALPEIIQNSGFVKRASTPFFYFTFRILYILIVMVIFNLFISIKLATKLSKEDQKPYKRNYWLLSIPILIGTIQHEFFHYYNIFFLPILLIAHLFNGSRAFAKLGSKLEEEDPFAKINQKELKDMGLVFDTDRGKLHVHNVFMGIMVQGGAGAGKSASIIEPAIYQWAMQNSSMTIYDFKGDPPTLGLMAYNSWLLNNKSTFKKPSFGVVSFNTQFLKYSERPNIFDPKTLETTVDTQAVLFTFLYGLNPDWRQKKDFWGQSATAAALGIVERLRKDPALHRYCTLPHFLLLATQDPTKLLTWIREDQEVERMIQTLLTNLDGQVMQTLSNQMSSLQSPLSALFSPQVFWVLGAEPEKQTSLDLNDLNNPRIMSISNDPKRDEALSPIIGAILKAIMRNVNQQGKHHHAFIIDELPTIFLDGLSKLPATARSNRVASCFGIQDESQLETQYGKQADEITANMGTFFLGMTNNPKTAKKYSDYFGTYETKKTSHSTSDSSLSFSDSLQSKKLLQEKDIAQQQVGHFVGKIADGDPGFFSVQTKEFKKDEIFNDWQDTISLPIEDPFLKGLFEKNSSMAEGVFSDVVNLNYLRIQAEVQQLMEKY